MKTVLLKMYKNLQKDGGLNRPARSHRFVVFALVVSIVHLWAISGCTVRKEVRGNPGGTQLQEGAGKALSGGRLSLFLNFDESEVNDRNIFFHALEVGSDTGEWHQIGEKLVSVDLTGEHGRQTFLARTSIPRGYYDRLRITMEYTDNAGERDPIVNVLNINPPLYVGRGDSHSLFLQWQENTGLQPKDADLKIALLPRTKKLLADIAYVACPLIDTVYMICLDKNRICDSLGVVGGPGFIAGGPERVSENLYVLAERKKRLNKVSASSNRVEASFPLSGMGDDLNFTVGPFAKEAFVIGRKRGTIQRINLRTGAIENKKRLGYAPSYIVYLENRNLLAVSLSLAQSVILVDPETLDSVKTIATSSKPEGLALYGENDLYIAESSSNSVMVYDLDQNRIRKRIPVDFNPHRIIGVGNNIYVTNRVSRTLSIIHSGKLGVSRTLKLEGEPLEVAYSSSNKWLYVGDLTSQAIDVVDAAVGRIAGKIVLGAEPHGLEVLR